MDPLSIISTVLSIALSITKWVDDTKNKDTTIHHLSTTVNLVYLILSPLEVGDTSRKLQPPILASLLSITEVLSRIKDHLALWKDKRVRASKLLGFLVPSRVVADLRDDAQILQQHLLAISFALHVSTFLHGQSKAVMSLPEPSHLELTKSAQAREFWHVMIGEHVRTFISAQ